MAALLDPFDLGSGDVPEPQALLGRGEERGGVRRRLRASRGEATDVFQSEQQLPLGRDEIRTVDRQERLAASHGLARSVDVQLLDVAGELGVDGV